ncbi:MAG: SDR family NAD(P)-dependent oxidoreductase [Alphaproteobacteria bacterium]|nr:SDR family NAD(P)-dependent oxidoreductase [Alphaproteobacteria bacterium]
MTISLEGRVALVTGAGRGLGRAHVLELAQRGVKVIVNDVGGDRGGGNPSRGPADDVVAEIVGNGGSALADYSDVTDAAAVERMVEGGLDAFGRIDAVVTNAGINRLAAFSDITMEDFAAIVGVHLFGTFNVVRAAYPALKASGSGRIVMTTSQIAWAGKADSPAYGAAKGGIQGLLATLRLTAPADGIMVNAVAPFAFTRAAEGVFPEALRPLLDPAQVSALVAYLASEACAVNGETLVAGGGHFAAAETRESVGIDFDDMNAITVEALASRLDEIRDMDGAILYDDALQAVGATFARLKARAGID